MSFLCFGSKKKVNEDEEESLAPLYVYNFNNGTYIKKVNLCIDKNGEEHYTSKYFHMRQGARSNLVVRRGQSFRIELLLNAPYNANDAICLTFTSSDAGSPRFGNGTLVAIALSDSDESQYAWKATFNSHEGNILSIDITPSPHCIVAKWKLEMYYKQNENIAEFSLGRNIYILFNPWCEEDQVFMESKEWREEAVLNTDGMIWCNLPSTLGRVWNYAQFDEDVLDCALDLFTELGNLNANFRSNPVHITRRLSTMVHASNGRGVLVGNWSNGYTGGVNPSVWMGSREILKKFRKKKKSVKYGQCWVFAGVLTSLCRALGMPARSVTNFNSAHDDDGSITIDYIVDDDGKSSLESDSVWSFHVWCEVWMKRPDLEKGYDGWQVIDAAPQEASDSIYRCGPASVIACKNGDINKPYDVGFVFSEVNADEAFWKRDPDTKECQLLYNTTKKIGQHISTKMPGKFGRLDLTDEYKFKEGSREERATYSKVMHQVDRDFGKSYIASKFKEVRFKFKYSDNITVGQSTDVCIVMNNTNRLKTHEVTTTLRLDVYFYTGKFRATIKLRKEDIYVESGNEVKFKMHVSFEDYRNFLTDNSSFVISCLASVANTNWHYFDRGSVYIKKPDVTIEVDCQKRVGDQVVGYVALLNPLPIPLKKGKFLIEAPGLRKRLKIKLKKDVLPGKEVIERFTFIPQMLGLQTVAAKFFSKELDDVEGFLQVDIES